MENKRIAEMIRNYKKGDVSALEQLWFQLLPLIKKYAGRSHFMEYDDAYQEYTLTLLEAVNKIQNYDTDGQCLKYIAISIKNKFCFLYKNHCATIVHETPNDIIAMEVREFSGPDPYSDTIFWTDICNFIESLPSDTKRTIARLSIIYQKSDAEIASYLGISRQYVNKIKKDIAETLF